MDLLDFINYPSISQLAYEYANAKPFPHIVLDDFLKEEVLEALEIPKPNHHWYEYRNRFEIKYATDRFDVMPNSVCKVLLLLNSQPFVAWLEKLTRLSGLVVDHTFRGGGIHSIPRGGFLHVHRDFTRHPALRLYRRLNILIYLNRNWHSEWGGNLELWSDDMKEKVQSIEPINNRCVIFDTSGDHFHGHPDPLDCPETRRRISLASYYYTAEPPNGIVPEDKSTQFKARPNDPTSPEIEALREKRNSGRLKSNV